ncbi:MAG: hypothetical protein Rubg2KO_10460 [Rubricoccaceae bacterium]
MRALSRPRSVLWLAAGLAVLLVGLAALQWRWIGRWSAVEEARLESTLRSGAAALNRDLTSALYTLQDAFADLSADDSDAANALAESLRRWQSDAESPNLVQAVYWATPGPSPQLRQLDGDTLELVSDSERLAPWQTVLQRYPARLQPAPGTSAVTLVLDEPTFPDQPPGLLVPAFPPPGRAGLPLRFVLIELADDALRNQLVPELIREHIVGHDLYDIRIVGRNGVLYTSTLDLSAEDFENADLTQPLGPSDVTELVFSLNASDQTADAEINLASLQTETLAGSENGRWRLQVRHRAGSIAAATRQLRVRQLALAFGVLTVLGAATALLILSVRRQRQLAQRQLAFVAGVTHELRTPLSVLHAAGENLSDGVVEDPTVARQYGTLVRDESRRLADMVETVLTYAGADATTARRSRLSSTAWIEDAIEQAQPVLDDTETTLTREVAPDLPPVHGDPIALATALRNLIANAARHGGAFVHISVKRGRADTLELAVSDDGTGIPAADREALFEPFVRGAAAIQNQTPGSGLGLALVTRIVEAHGGTVELATTPETTFTITLPVSS